MKMFFIFFPTACLLADVIYLIATRPAHRRGLERIRRTAFEQGAYIGAAVVLKNPGVEWSEVLPAAYEELARSETRVANQTARTE